jgi:hypothetical protein
MTIFNFYVKLPEVMVVSKMNKTTWLNILFHMKLIFGNTDDGDWGVATNGG